MKKTILLILAILAIIIATISYLYMTNKANYEMAQKQNVQYESYYQQEIYGPDLATLINKAVDDNNKNDVEKTKKGKYIENTTNSINIDIKFTDDNTIHAMEEIYNGGISTFIQYYNQIKFKCTKIDYHASTHKVKYMLFEQITG